MGAWELEQAFIGCCLWQVLSRQSLGYREVGLDALPQVRGRLGSGPKVRLGMLAWMFSRGCSL